MIKLIKKNILSIITALIIMYLSLASSDSFDEVPVFDLPYLDKIIHFGMYFALMMSLLYENRSSNNKFRNQLMLAFIPFIYGILLEFAQLWFTATRSGEIMDAVFDLVGIVFALSAWRIYKNLKKEQN
jgi:VanZ family protein